MNDELSQRIARLPREPGVYLMKGAGDETIYIGKATDLRSRVKSYFTGGDPRPFVAHLDALLVDVEVIVTSNPKEALLLENTLIKKHRPRFNFMLRDDKNYLSLRIDERAEWPRVELVRAIRSDGASYFGPYHSAQSARRTLTVLNRHFRLRTCPDAQLYNRSRPCLQYQIKRCPGPCVLPVDRDAYLDDVRHAALFLSGREDELTRELEARMHRAAEDLAFEDAALYRDQLDAVRATLTRQGTVQTRQVDQDIVGLYREGEVVAVSVLVFRSGSMTDVASFDFDAQLVEDDALLASFVAQYYASDARQPPAELLLPVYPTDADDLAEALSEMRGTKVRLVVPQRGEKKRLMELAAGNAKNRFQDELSHEARERTILEKVRRRLKLRETPRTFECYDISNFQGDAIVASQVAFRGVEPDREHYRRLRVRSTTTQDDFASMFEVLRRRAKRALDGTHPMPDLLIIDGGKGQLSRAEQALHDLGLHDQAIVSLAKSRVKGVDADDATTRSPERVFVPGARDAIVLPPHSDEAHFFARIRDEAHRVAITFHRSLRDKARVRSALDEIPGVGKTRRNELLRHFGSLRGVRDASLTELEAAPGLGSRLAWKIYDHFHPGEADPPSDD